MALKMYGKYNNAEEREMDAPRRKAMRDAKSKAIEKKKGVVKKDKENGKTYRYEPQPYLGVGPHYNVRREVKDKD